MLVEVPEVARSFDSSGHRSKILAGLYEMTQVGMRLPWLNTFEARAGLVVNLNMEDSGFESEKDPSEQTDSPERAEIATLQQQVAELKMQLAAMEQLVYIDELTGLPNRRALLRELETELRAIKRQAHNRPEGITEAEPQTRLVYIDLDGFKAINDNLSHHDGDQILKEVSLRLAEQVRPGDFVARLGGDEFVLLLRNVSLQDAESVIKRIEIETTIEDYGISGSFGLHLISPDLPNAEQVLMGADVQMQKNKDAKKVPLAA